MTTEVSTVNAAALVKGLRRTKVNRPSFGGKQYLKFQTDGDWTLGRSMDARNDENVVLNVNSMQHGYVAWSDYDKKERKKNERLGEEMCPITQGEIDPSTLPDVGWPWKLQYQVEGRFLSGSEEFKYSTNSLGGIEVVSNVVDAVLDRVEDGEEVYIYPVVRLESDWYEHSQYGKTWKPVLNIVGWANMDGVLENEVAKVEDKSKPAPEKAQVEDEEEPAAAPVDDGGQTDEDPAPRRRRRRG